jgi:hypothetical protein|nr:MAG TPA: hypothetical protein [Caudoviricetes sp.]
MNNNPMQFLMQLMRVGSNPNQILNSLMMQNPQMQTILEQVKQSGMSAKDFTIQYAQKNNIDLNGIVQMLSNYGIKL